MGKTKTSDDIEDRFAQYFEQQLKQEAPTQTGGVDDAPPVATDDARLSVSPDRDGLVQLNVRVPKEIKERLIELRAKRRQGGVVSSAISQIVTEALTMYLDHS